MPRLDESRPELIRALGDRYGPLPPSGSGPPGVSNAFEAVASAAIGLVADARVVPAALEVLRGAGWLDPAALASADPLEVDEQFRSARLRLGSKALKPLIRIARWAADRGPGAADFATMATESLREEWRGLNGVGPATADRLLLAGLGRAAYPMDRATYRVLVRHGWLDASADYDEARSVVEGLGEEDPATLAFLATAFERLGRDCCKPAVARCDRCPLRDLLPPDGPREVGD